MIYNKHGLAGFSRKIRNGSYSKEFKMKVVEEYIRGDGSSIDLGIKYDIPSGLLRNWIRMYNANRALKDYNPKQEVYMAERMIWKKSIIRNGFMLRFYFL